MTSSNTKLRVCLLQFASQENVAKSIIHLEELVEKAVKEHQPQIIALPECFATEYNTDVPFLESVAETIEDGQICRTFSTLSQKFGVYIVGGSIVERDGDKMYNTSTVWNSNGELIARHRKVHLCNCHYDNGVEIVEVNRFSPGNDMTTFEVNGIKCGVAICFDAWFDEFIKMYTKSNCDVLFIPAAYNVYCGTKSFELVHRARANENQLYVAAVSPARDEKLNYVNYGHSLIVDPTGDIQAKAGIAEEILFYEMDLNSVRKTRRETQLFASRRVDVYNKLD
ncbi:omega-amidase NIT2-like [Sitodiplosis mosellana]|uniref:omega-amidase NIT2-like n=1 Tax=Sitodiplosis mosellana TaxID=263140 RepID=UPI002444E842|nr:omega-amidase NIT2-like [Sitodiplosis mosellana]